MVPSPCRADYMQWFEKKHKSFSDAIKSVQVCFKFNLSVGLLFRKKSVVIITRPHLNRKSLPTGASPRREIPRGRYSTATSETGKKIQNVYSMKQMNKKCKVNVIEWNTGKEAWRHLTKVIGIVSLLIEYLFFSGDGANASPTRNNKNEWFYENTGDVPDIN